MAADCEHITLRNLSDVGKYSYASLCSIILSNLFETSLDRYSLILVNKRYICDLIPNGRRSF